MHFFREHIIFIPLIVWVVSVVAKGIYLYIKNQFSVSGAMGSGGMPSVHSAFVTSISTAVGIKYGIASDLFAICLVFTTIIIYDAINVRFEVGLHAKELNKTKNAEKIFNESVGHLPQEAFVGSLIGIFVSFALMMI
ncbi:MAG: divergent PAP2 family protein [Candidatus Gracilibacteria bacterium]|nr:divergent PAP2 family protein [Candidatus Gracilibacteria bacterium]MDD3120186.1 divergent PAP2 family protein [Candidatus Gracilibacteria bacterium]MDD4531078.1 divergent PAP2 family protein [Candidatus Gracilibacteria bacterium]